MIQRLALALAVVLPLSAACSEEQAKETQQKVTSFLHDVKEKTFAEKDAVERSLTEGLETLKRESAELRQKAATETDAAKAKTEELIKSLDEATADAQKKLVALKDSTAATWDKLSHEAAEAADKAHAALQNALKSK
jgi:hypothetical protein